LVSVLFDLMGKKIKANQLLFDFYFFISKNSFFFVVTIAAMIP